MIKSEMLRWLGIVLDIDAMRNAYKILISIYEGKTPLGGPSYSLEYNIKTDLKQTW
jgi:hypothetical protein